MPLALRFMPKTTDSFTRHVQDAETIDALVPRIRGHSRASAAKTTATTAATTAAEAPVIPAAAATASKLQPKHDYVLMRTYFGIKLILNDILNASTLATLLILQRLTFPARASVPPKSAKPELKPPPKLSSPSASSQSGTFCCACTNKSHDPVNRRYNDTSRQCPGRKRGGTYM